MNYALPPHITGFLSGRRVLLTGSHGFLGQHFCAALRDCGAFVEEVDAKIGRYVRDWHQFGPLDAIIYGAGIASPHHYRQHPWRALDASVSGLRHVLENSEAPLLFLSSSEIYGDPTIVPTPETYTGASDPMGQRSPYDEGKRLGETLCHLAATHGTKRRAVVVRLFNAFGPGMAEDDRRFMPELRRVKRSGEPMRIFGTGLQTRTFCYVTDTIRGCLQALVDGRSGVPYNIGASGPEVSMLDVCKLAGVPVEVVEAPETWPSGGDPNRRCPDIARARIELGYEPAVRFEDGLERFLES